MKNIIITLLAAIALLTSCEVNFPTVSPDEFELMLSEPEVQLIDARRDDEVALGYIAGSMHIDVLQPGFKKKAISVLDRNRKVLVHCQSGKRGAKAAEILKRAGFDVYNLEGGFNAWTEAGKPYLVPEKETFPAD
ncbi:MAG: rhodanese-like domain-containing protein [Bacteroidales bacterium]|nr:rhodanese-like domain-containing protein [Bacteroidales bacterium]MDT3357275.1 rhodanese-like domain-containing protein [Bacteroidota bacterium]